MEYSISFKLALWGRSKWITANQLFCLCFLKKKKDKYQYIFYWKKNIFYWVTLIGTFIQGRIEIMYQGKLLKITCSYHLVVLWAVASKNVPLDMSTQRGLLNAYFFMQSTKTDQTAHMGRLICLYWVHNCPKLCCSSEPAIAQQPRISTCINLGLLAQKFV